MAQNETLKAQASTVNTLAMPAWFIIVVAILLGLRVYAKLTQTAAQEGHAIAWITTAQLKAQKPSKALILYEFTADWCPPCRKRERTAFRAPTVINQINNNFVPVKVDLTTRSGSEKPEVKELTDKFNVESIPRCIITLDTGEFVCDDRYRMTDDFNQFLANAEGDARQVRAELALARGDYRGALQGLDQEMLKGAILWQSEKTRYLMCHHLLYMLDRQAEIEPMMRASYAKTLQYAESSGKKAPVWLDNLNSYLRGNIDEKELLSHCHLDSERADSNLAIGLKYLRNNDKVKALRALNQAALYAAKSYEQDKLAEMLVKELEK